MGKKISHETSHCIALMEVVRRSLILHPELDLLFHIPNEGKRSKAAGGIAKAMGLKKGVWDFLLPVPRAVPEKRYAGLWVEMKREGKGLEPEQEEWGEKMRAQGYMTRVCFTWEEAFKVLVSYLRLGHAGK